MAEVRNVMEGGIRMLIRVTASAVALALLAPPAAAQVSVDFTVSATIDVSAGIVVAAPAPVVVLAPPPVVVVRPVAPAPVAVPVPPPVVVVRLVAPAPIVLQAVPQPLPIGGANVVLQSPLVEQEDSVDLLAFGSYRNVFGAGELGGMDFALRVLLGDQLSFETRFGYLAGGTEAGGNFEEAPVDFSLLWYPWDRDFPIYFGVGAGFAWGSKWDESLADPLDPFGSWGASREVWLASTRAVVGAELELFDFLLLTAETEFFYRASTESDGYDAGAGFSFDLGLGIRL
jgi:hypothetical protein